MEEIHKPFRPNMTHVEAARYLRNAFVPTFEYETAGLVEALAVWIGVRSIMCEFDFLAALYCGFDGSRDAKLQNRRRFVTFLSEVVAEAAGARGYALYARHLYDMFRVGTVHTRSPVRLRNTKSRTPVLTWMVMKNELSEATDSDGRMLAVTHLTPIRVDPETTRMPLSLPVLFRDCSTAALYFAERLEDEAAKGGDRLIRRWRMTANTLAEPVASSLRW